MANKTSNVDPVSAVLGGLSFGGSVVNSILGNSQNKRTLRAQQEENEKNRQFNHNEAALSRQYGLDVLHDQQAYNSPVEFVKRLQAAGLNPALAYSQLSDDAASSPSSTPASSSGGLSPLPYQGFDSLTLSQAALNNAKARNIQEDTRNKQFQGTILESDAKYRDAFNAGTIEVMGVQVNVGNSQAKWNDQDVYKSKQLVENLVTEREQMIASIDKVRAETGLLDQKSQAQLLDNLFAAETFQSRVRDLAARAQLSEDTAKVYLSMAFCQMSNIQADTLAKTRLSEVYNEQKYLIHTQNGLILPKQGALMDLSYDNISFQLDQDKKYSDFERIVNIGSTVVSSITDIAGTVMTRGANKSIEALNKSKENYYNSR